MLRNNRKGGALHNIVTFVWEISIIKHYLKII